ncbi:hypothetical protein [Xenorhabdus miraniensis]|uniref:hypothetical protein n=1 Tax=Xenorhabdus miraniensis TaxID=351674 RepID=UPI0011AB67AE|nr:hypothetical protein [Xenorhabdus miraniensis]
MRQSERRLRYCGVSVEYAVLPPVLTGHPYRQKSQPRYRQVLLFQSKNAVSDSLRGEAGVSLSGFDCSLAAASLSAVNPQKVTP